MKPMTQWRTPSRGVGQSGNPGIMFIQLDRGIPVRPIRRQPIFTSTGFNTFLSTQYMARLAEKLGQI